MNLNNIRNSQQVSDFLHLGFLLKKKKKDLVHDFLSYSLNSPDFLIILDRYVIDFYKYW